MPDRLSLGLEPYPDASLDRPLHVADIGAAYINYAPPYKGLIDRGLGRLSAFEPDTRHHAALRAAYGPTLDLYGDAIADGTTQTLYRCMPSGGMTSLLKPSRAHLALYATFDILGRVTDEVPIKTRRLDDIETLAPIDFLKMDIQGAELAALENGLTKLTEAVAIQTEVCFVPLYENHPTFGDIDVWMKRHGFMPHTIPELVRWTLAPYQPPAAEAKQVLYADVVYIRDPARLDLMSDEQILRLATLALHVFGTIDLADLLLRRLRDRQRPVQAASA